MARLAWNGAETQLLGSASANDAEGDLWITSTTTIATATPHGGAAYYSCAPSATSHVRRLSVGAVLDRPYFIRAYLRFTSVTPSSAVTVLSPSVTTVLRGQIRLETNGTLTLRDSAAAQVGSASPALAANTWYRVEMKVMVPTAGNGTLAFKLDGVEIVPDTAASTLNVVFDEVRAGHSTSGETAVTVLVDCVAINDDQGASQNTYPGDGKIVLLKPISDSAVGAGWEAPQTTGSDVTGIFAAVDNTPPVGVAHSDLDANNLKYIFNATSTAVANYDANVQSYIAAGLPASGYVRIAQALVRTGSSSATDTAGAVALVSNPSQGAETAFLAFDSGIAGTETTNWKTARGALVYEPNVVLATSPVVRVGKRTANVLVAMVDLLGVMVEYTTRRPPARSRQAGAVTMPAAGGVYS